MIQGSDGNTKTVLVATHLIESKYKVAYFG